MEEIPTYGSGGGPGPVTARAYPHAIIARSGDRCGLTPAKET
jgi:hypothetical protein